MIMWLFLIAGILIGVTIATLQYRIKNRSLIYRETTALGRMDIIQREHNRRRSRS